MDIRPSTQKAIDKCHAEIKRLIEVERAWQKKNHPEAFANSLWESISDASLEVASWNPEHRVNARMDAATLRKMHTPTRKTRNDPDCY